jgi:hypothetical protein
LITDLHLFSITPTPQHPNIPFFITKKEFLYNRPGNDMANKLPDPIFFVAKIKIADF